MIVQRLGKENYDEIIGLMNAVFSRKNGREMNFELELPKMCVRDEESMRKHFGIFEDGKLVSCIGVYPFETMVYGQKLLFATMGNLVTHWDYEGKGYMTALLKRATQELTDLDVNVARLGGLRSRYNNYGFEACGQRYGFTFTSKNREKKFPALKDDIEFKKVEKDDKEALDFITKLYNKNEIAVLRTKENAFVSATAWKNKIYVAIRKNSFVGYLCADEVGTRVAEAFAIESSVYRDMLCAWQKKCDNEIYFSLQPHQIDLARIFVPVCEQFYIGSPCHFYIRNWDKVVDAFMKLKASYSRLTKGELCIEIKAYGVIKVFVDENGVGCERTNKTPHLSMDRLESARYIFGPYPPIVTDKADTLAQSWFPLPLGWNLQDRV